MVPIWPGFRQYDGLKGIVEGGTVGDDFRISRELRVESFHYYLSEF